MDDANVVKRDEIFQIIVHNANNVLSTERFEDYLILMWVFFIMVLSESF